MESKATWEDAPDDIIVTISIAKGRQILRNEIRVPMHELMRDVSTKPHMPLAKYMEDYFYPMAQKFCDRVFTRTNASPGKE